MKQKGLPKLFTYFFYVHWLIDLAIAVLSFLFLVIIVTVSISNRQLADLGSLIFGLIAMVYGVANFLVKRNNDLREIAALQIEAINVFENCRNVIVAYYPNVDDLTLATEEKVLATYLEDWKKHKSIKPFEYQLVDSYLNHVVSAISLDESEKLFLKYRVVSSTLTSHFPALVSEIENGDYFTNGTVHNKFIKKIYLVANEADVKASEDIELEAEKIQETISYALKKSNPAMENLLKEKKSREKIQYLLTKCYENAYSNIGNLDKELGDDSKRNLTLLFKYDERFSIPKRQWHTEIKNQLSKKYTKEKDLNDAYEKEVAKLKTMMTGLHPVDETQKESPRVD